MGYTIFRQTHINIEAGNDIVTIVVYPRFRPSPDLRYHWHFPWPGIPSQSCASHHGFQAPEIYCLWLSGIHRGSGLRSILDRRSQVPRFFSNPVLVPIPVLTKWWSRPYFRWWYQPPNEAHREIWGLLVQNAAKSLVLIAQWEYPAEGDPRMWGITSGRFQRWNAWERFPAAVCSISN